MAIPVPNRMQPRARAMFVALLYIAAASAALTPIKVGRTSVFVASENIIRVTHDPTDAPSARPSLIARQHWPKVDFKTTEDAQTVTIETSKMRVVVQKATGKVSMLDSQGNRLLAETDTSFNATSHIPGESTSYIVTQSWAADNGESLYGGGEFQNGLLDFAGTTVQMIQFNTEAVVPFFVSSRGYGLLWDQYSASFLNPPSESQLLDFHAAPSAGVTIEDGTPAELLSCHDDPRQGCTSAAKAVRAMHSSCTATTVGYTQQLYSNHSWIYSAADGSISLKSDSNKLLDMDYPKGDVHLWTRSRTFRANQQWNLTGSQLEAQHHPGKCLCAGPGAAPGSQLTLAACDPSDAKQQWTLDEATGHLTCAASVMQAFVAQRAHAELSAPQLCVEANDKAPMATATFTPSSSGVHSFYIELHKPPSFGAGFGITLQLWSGDGSHASMIVDWEALTNLPNSISGKAYFAAGVQATLSLSYKGFKGGQPKVYMQGPNPVTHTLQSLYAHSVDYWFVHGGGSTLDAAIAGYREITGAAPMYAQWVYGFWQCKEHYATQQGLLDAAHGFRNRSIPVDSIVQDWHYWGNLGWGPHWDPAFYADPAAMVKELESINMHLMVSVWSKFDYDTKPGGLGQHDFWQQMNASGFVIGGSQYYDPYNRAARELFYSFSKQAMFDIGVDSLWLDATEPEGLPNVNNAVHLGSGNEYMNPYSLMTTKAISDGLRRDFGAAQGARVFTLTRSSFAGQQTTGATLWSGDISGAWDSLRRQVAASLNYQMSGIPYWSEDIGGFFRPHDQYTSQDYHDMLTRWFQFGVWTPVYRVHGGGSNTEIWNYGNTVMTVVNNTHNLRYRLLPYTYSGFHRVATEGYTMQRALALEWPAASQYAAVADQFMWGAAFMVAPVVSQSDNLNRSRAVLLPDEGSPWTCFWEGKAITSPQFQAHAPIDFSPVFVRAGSVVPLGPYLQHTGEHPADPLEVRIYQGADGSFALYEDDGKSPQPCASSLIQMDWTDSTKALTVGARVGTFPGMLTSRRLHIVVVSEGRGVGVEPVDSPDIVTSYTGEKLVCSLVSNTCT